MEHGIVHALVKTWDQQNLQTPVRVRAPQQIVKRSRLILGLFAITAAVAREPTAWLLSDSNQRSHNFCTYPGA